jgi:hypothetical protein
MDMGCLGVILAVGLGWLVLCWPALFAHGQTVTGGWRWDIHSTIACSVWWGVLAVPVIAALVVKGNAYRKLPKPPPPPPEVKVPRRFGFALDKAPAVAVQAAPVCVHPAAVPVDNDMLGRLAWWCPSCETQLDAAFVPPRRTCCGTPARTPHAYNCPARMNPR